MKEMRVAVVGLVKRGVQAWLPAIERLQGFRITAICDPIEALHDWAREPLTAAAEVKAYLHYEEVLADDNVDAVILTVRCPEQGAMAAMALEAGKHMNQEVPAAGILAAESIAQGSRPLHVPDFRPSATRPKGEMLKEQTESLE